MNSNNNTNNGFSNNSSSSSSSSSNNANNSNNNSNSSNNNANNAAAVSSASSLVNLIGAAALAAVTSSASASSTTTSASSSSSGSSLSSTQHVQNVTSTSGSASVASLQQQSAPVSITVSSSSSPAIPPPPIPSLSLPLSSSLPSSISSSLAASSSAVHVAHSSQSHSSTSTTTSQANNDNKMDTSGPIGSSNGCTSNGFQTANSGCGSGSGAATSGSAVFVGDVISRLYPNVNQQETPLPRQWSSTHKCQTLQLSNGNLRVTYKGPGKTHKDAASVRTDYPIPASCGIYYFEVKIISKGRDGYMGIGLSKSDVQLSRLPGWDKNSYGYHGDDGHSFCCSGTGQNYGPTFTTGDIIGCCLNLIENTCFYTKNGYNLGVAFRDLPSDLYPTVGLQTPSESVEANFGQYPFEFDIHNYVKEWHLKTRQTIERFPLKKENEVNLPIILRKLISTYLVHHGYSSTAEAFAKSVGHVFEEELASIRNRQRIQKLVLNGRLCEAIELTYQLFPGILERNSNLLFALKVRQFIEMINNANSPDCLNTAESSSDLNSKNSSKRNLNLNESKLTSPIYSSNNQQTLSVGGGDYKDCSMMIDSADNQVQNQQDDTRFHNGTCSTNNNNGYVSKYNNSNSNTNSSNNLKKASVASATNTTTTNNLNEEAMDMDSSPIYVNQLSKTSCDDDDDNDDDVVNVNDVANNKKINNNNINNVNNNNNNSNNKNKNILSFEHNYSYLQKILQFGRELFQMNSSLEQGDNQTNTKMLRDAFSLLAYHDPWNSPLGYQLDSSQREPISAMLNSAILESNNMPRIPPLEVVYGQTSECMRLMSKYGIAWCAYVNLNDYMQS